MLTPRENFMEVHTGGKPDRFVKQFEFFQMAMVPGLFGAPPEKEGDEVVDSWGVTSRWTPGVVNAFPVHDDEHKVIKDIRKWQDYVIAPSLDFSEEEWAWAKAEFEKIDRSQVFAAVMAVPGFFEHLHGLMGMTPMLEYLATEPEAIKGIIAHYLDYQLRRADVVASHVKADMLLFGDDLGTMRNSFISPAMFKEYFLEAYQTLFRRWREHGVELIYMHNDSYSANLVPLLIEAGVNVWQGVMTECDCPALVKEFGGQMTFMGDINSGIVDSPYWTREIVEAEVRRACTTNGKLYFVPCMTMALPPTLYPGVDEYLDECIEMMSKEMF